MNRKIRTMKAAIGAMGRLFTAMRDRSWVEANFFLDDIDRLENYTRRAQIFTVILLVLATLVAVFMAPVNGVIL